MMAVIREKTMEIRSSIQVSATTAAHRIMPVATITAISADIACDHLSKAAGEIGGDDNDRHDRRRASQQRNGEGIDGHIVMIAVPIM